MCTRDDDDCYMRGFFLLTCYALLVGDVAGNEDSRERLLQILEREDCCRF